jgi:predicted enzyme related to lactoylglutathione lyase/catechol 2,3-dioxygenase-like lactoylglutathione lyase family enzyme
MHFKPMICAMLLPVFSLALFFPAPAFAQLTPVNESGVTVGHVHLLVPDPEAHKKLWIDLFGAQVAKTGSLEFLKLPGIVLLIGKGQPADAVGEPTADHFALVVRDLAAAKIKLAAAKIPMPDGKIAEFPDGVRVEFIEDKNLGVPVAFHHFHIFTADADALRDWYAKSFGGVKFPDGPNFPGGQIYFTAQSNPPRVPTKGHALDHISFEIKGLQEFCKKLEAQGTKLDMNIIDAPQIGLKVTFVTDPVGTRIELTDGFAGK